MFRFCAYAQSVIINFKVETVQKRKTNVLLWTMTIAMGFGVVSCMKSSMPEPTPARAYYQLCICPYRTALDVFFNDTKVSTNAFPQEVCQELIILLTKVYFY